MLYIICDILKDLTHTERLKKLKLPSLAHPRRRGDMIQTFKIIKGVDNIPSERFFKLCNSSSTLGHSLKLENPRRRTTMRLQFEFKSKLDQHWNHEVIYVYKSVNMSA